MASRWNQRLKRMEALADAFLKQRLERLVAERPDLARHVDALRGRRAELTRGVVGLGRAPRHIGFTTYLARETPRDAEIISIVAVEVATELVVEHGIFLPPKREDDLASSGALDGLRFCANLIRSGGNAPVREP